VTELVITRGLPGSGKSTWAGRWAAAGGLDRAEVNRDALRMMMFGRTANDLTPDHEPLVTAVQDAAVTALLAAGVSVVCSDTNLPDEVAARFAVLASRAGAAFRVADLRDVPLDLCLARNAARADKPPVPERWIRDMHARYIADPVPGPEGELMARAERADYEKD